MGSFVRPRRWLSALFTSGMSVQPGRFAMPMALTALLMMGGAPGADAQAGTPTAGSDVVTPAECTVAPRPEGELRALFREEVKPRLAKRPQVGAYNQEV